MSELSVEVKDVEEKVEAVIEKKLQELDADEKLLLREIENEYLKASMEVQRLQQVLQAKQKEFQEAIKKFTTKYVINEEVWLFDSVALVFRRK